MQKAGSRALVPLKGLPATAFPTLCSCICLGGPEHGTRGIDAWVSSRLLGPRNPEVEREALRVEGAFFLFCNCLFFFRFFFFTKRKKKVRVGR